MFRSYLRLLVFAFGLLVGVQVPGLVDDYGKRVAAQRAESEESPCFRETAARFFNAPTSTPGRPLPRQHRRGHA